jgi:hypothetical protein
MSLRRDFKRGVGHRMASVVELRLILGSNGVQKGAGEESILTDSVLPSFLKERKGVERGTFRGVRSGTNAVISTGYKQIVPAFHPGTFRPERVPVRTQ